MPDTRTMMTCKLCTSYGLSFSQPFAPSEFIVGDPSSPVWIIGLNPKSNDHINDLDSTDKLHAYFEDITSIHPYFRDIKKVSPKLFLALGKTNGVAHTDLVKCHSEEWFPTKGGMRDTIVRNCSGYLIKQIETHKPRILFCNGADVCRFMIQTFVPPDEFETCYKVIKSDFSFWIVLSGFIGRIDNYSKRRLGREIETLLEQEKC